MCVEVRYGYGVLPYYDLMKSILPGNTRERPFKGKNNRQCEGEQQKSTAGVRHGRTPPLRIAVT
jgi:hypothetical protein